MKKQVKKTVKPAIQGKTINEALRLLQQQYHHLETVIDGTIDQDIGQLRNDVDQQSARIDHWLGESNRYSDTYDEMHDEITKLKTHLDASDNLNHVTMSQLEQRLNTEVSAINNQCNKLESHLDAASEDRETIIEQEDYIINLENQVQVLSEALLDCNDQLIDTDGDATTHWTF